jgi:microcystin-dependent protein
MKRLILSISLFTICFVNVYSQVAIQNPTPNAGSILDLTNSTNSSLLLPQSSLNPTTVGNFTTEGMLFYYQDKLFLKTNTTTNVISPWIFDGTNSNGMSTPSSMPIGIGMAPLASSPTILQIASSSDVTVSTSDASIGIGLTSGTHLLMDSDELLAKTNASTAGVLKLQEDGGTVTVRTGAVNTTSAVLSANGSIDAAGSGKILQNGLDLIPAGTILMWTGTVDASGYPLIGGTPNTNWRICDGGSGTPDLREQFIVGSGGNNATVPGGGYTSSNTGGENFHTLTLSEMATHNHSGSTSPESDHTHDVSSIPNGGEGYVLAFNSSNEVYKWANTGNVTSTSEPAHSHTLNINNTGGGGAHENRPPYYALIYIIKL